MATVNEAYTAMADLNLWLKSRSGDPLVLSDLPQIIPLRWNYFKTEWEYIKPDLQSKVASYGNPDFFNQQIKDFDNFIQSQRIISKIINPFQDSQVFYKYYAIFDNIFIDSINLTNEESRIIKQKTDTIAALSKNDFLKIKNAITEYRDRYADSVNLSDDTYDHAFNRSSIPPQLDASITDANKLLVLQKSISNVDFVLANLFAVDAFVDPFALARQNANNPDIDIGSYASGRLVKINYGEDLQSLANRYFGNPDKWIDIAIANGLKPPYIDEVGEKLFLISNGSGNQINLPKTSNTTLNIDKIYINQPVYLQSNTQVFPDQRTIINIKQIPVSGEIVLELDGEPDLDKYKLSELANIRVYKPNTINSSLYVLIPSQEPLDDQRREETPWFLAKSAEDEKRAKVDIAVDDKGEINFTTNGDIRLSFGLENAIQAIQLKMLTELGSLKRHPAYGLINVAGSKNNDIDAIKTQLIESISAQIEADDRFDRIENLAVDYLVSNTTNQGVAAFGITLSVRLAGGQRVIPISFSVNI